jgi:hypothetical protein
MTDMMNLLGQVFSQEGEAMIRELGKKLDNAENIGSFSPSIYDTAWLARIRLPDDSGWLFPDSFEYLLTLQQPQGDWTPERSQIDGILNTMAALVALKEHAARPDAGNSLAAKNLEQMIFRAEGRLRLILEEWDVASTVHVGFEMLVPGLLSVLESSGSRFDFSGRALLTSLGERKFRKFNPEMMYSPRRTTLVHSLEALVGKIDFDRVSHHLDERGSMMGSPAATAAYLMNRSTWDPAAEDYLRSTVTHSSGMGCGSVPGAFPSPIFELTWIVSTLLKASLSPALLALGEAATIRNYLQLQFEKHDGLLGFGKRPASPDVPNSH